MANKVDSRPSPSRGPADRTGRGDRTDTRAEQNKTREQRRAAPNARTDFSRSGFETSSPQRSQRQGAASSPAARDGLQEERSEKQRQLRQATVDKLARVPTDKMTEAQKYDHYQRLTTMSGGKFNTTKGVPNILSIRTPTDMKVNKKGVYDDRTAVSYIDGGGNKRVREFASNTEPAARYQGREGEDVNRDGRKDLGRMMPGYYEYKYEKGNPRHGDVLRPTQDMIVARDTNQDGWFNDNQFGNARTSMLFHKGNRNDTASAGCQTMRPDDFKQFMETLNLGGEGRPKKVGYTLVERKKG